MARLRIASAADAAEPNESCLAALDEVREGVMSGQITNMVILLDGPQTRDGLLAGEVDGDAMLGFANRWLLSVMAEGEE